VRFLVDRCAGRRLADWLREQGHDVLESRNLRPDPGDRALLKLAGNDGRVLVTVDTDFGRLVFAEKERQSGILRLADVRVEQRIELVQQVLTGYNRDLESGAVITVKGNRIRVSRPPT
jgi:predicted nuclease of predicted toxin-antitoxin system